MSLRIAIVMKWFFNEFWEIKWDLQGRQLMGQHEKTRLSCKFRWRRKSAVSYLNCLLYVRPPLLNKWQHYGLRQDCQKFCRINGFLASATLMNTDYFILLFTYLPGKTEHLEKEKCVAGKFSKQRFAGVARNNVLCQKLPIFMIGKANKPRCFKR